MTYSLLSGEYTGGSEIVSLHLEWDQGSSGSYWQTLIGFSPFSLADSYTLGGSVVSGQTYQFRYRAANIFGWGDYSDPAYVTAASVPNTPTAVIVSQEGTQVKFAWSSDTDDNGSEIIAYSLSIATAEGTMLEFEDCDASQEPVLVNCFCMVDMAALTASPFDLAPGELIEAQVRASNSIGWSANSPTNTEGVLVQQAPLATPADLSFDEQLSTSQQIKVLIPPFTSLALAGNSPITKYSLESDFGTSETTWTTVSSDEHPLQLEHTISPLTLGATYLFRYRVENIYGASPYSNSQARVAAEVPAQPEQPLTRNTLTSVSVEWKLAFNGGAKVTGFIVEIQPSSGEWREEQTYCNARNDYATIVNRLCVIPMSVLEAEPFNLGQGAQVVARVAAVNQMGTSLVSEPSEK